MEQSNARFLVNFYLFVLVNSTYTNFSLCFIMIKIYKYTQTYVDYKIIITILKTNTFCTTLYIIFKDE